MCLFIWIYKYPKYVKKYGKHIFSSFASSCALGLHNVKPVLKNYMENGIPWENNFVFQ